MNTLHLIKCTGYIVADNAGDIDLRVFLIQLANKILCACVPHVGSWCLIIVTAFGYLIAIYSV